MKPGLGLVNSGYHKNHARYKGCVSHWIMTEGGGLTVYDATGNNYIGTLNGNAAWTSGQFGSAIIFDGADDYIEFTKPAGISPSTPFSVCFWAYSTTSVGITSTMMGNMTDSDFNACTLRWGDDLGAGTPNQPEFSITANSATVEEKIRVTNALSLNTWYHLGFTYDGSQTVGGMLIYVNGIAVALTTVTNTGFGAFTDNPWRVGSNRQNPPNDEFFGRLDDIRVYNRVLTQQELFNFVRDPFAEFAFKRHYYGLTDGAVASPRRLLTGVGI